MSCVVSIDLGSTAFKTALYDRSLQPLAKAEAPIPYLPDEHGRLDWAAALKTCHEMLGKMLCECEEPVSAIAITSQAQTFALRQKDRDPQCFWSWRHETPEDVLRDARPFGEERILPSIVPSAIQFLGLRFAPCVKSVCQRKSPRRPPWNFYQEPWLRH